MYQTLTKAIDAENVEIIAGAEVTSARLELAIGGWLAEKYERTRSECTRRSYINHLTGYRMAVLANGCDLNYLPQPGEPDLRTEVARAWAHAGEVAAATRNNRLAILASFFKYALENNLIAGGNPIAPIKRGKVQAYRGAVPMSRQYISARMREIDRTASAGSRDFALIHVYLQTAQRLNAVANLSWGDVHQAEDGRLRLTFRRVKGGDELTCTLDKSVSAALLDYLHKLHGAYIGQLEVEQPLWVSLQERNWTVGHKLSTRAISDIVKKRLGTGKVHALRHSAAANLLDRGATLVEIQRKLGHANAATTSIYLSRIVVEEDKFAAQQAADFGALALLDSVPAAFYARIADEEAISAQLGIALLGTKPVARIISAAGRRPAPDCCCGRQR